MAEGLRMTAAREAVEQFLASKHTDVLRQSVAWMVAELMEAEVCPASRTCSVWRVGAVAFDASVGAAR